jgi:ferredoxin
MRTDAQATRRGHLFPEWIALDDWGYPIIKPGDIPPVMVDHPRRAADACPSVALTLRRGESA